MNDFISYSIQVNIGIILFYGCYRLFLSKDTFWKMKRFYLLGSIIIPLVASLLHIRFSVAAYSPAEGSQFIQQVASIGQIIIMPTPQQASQQGTTFMEIIFLIYAIISGILLIRFCIRLASILTAYTTYNKVKIRDVSVYTSTKEIAPYSFFGFIFLNPALHSDEELRQIICHEQSHSRQIHSFDVIIAELSCCLFWFNPAIWMLKREIRYNHEFLADQEVLRAGFNMKEYQYHLLESTCLLPNTTLGNQFNVLPIKKRIIMMNIRKSPKRAYIKYALVIPVTFLLLTIANANPTTNDVAKTVNTILMKQSDSLAMPIEASQTNVLKTNETTEASSTQQEPNMAANNSEMPEKNKDMTSQYPGGETGMVGYFARNMKYPIEAVQNAIQGDVVIGFEVSKTGKVENLQILSSSLLEQGKEDTYYSSNSNLENAKSNTRISLQQITVVAYNKDNNETTQKSQSMKILEDEAIRVTKGMADWTPAIKNGEPVSTSYSLPIRYKLQ